MNLTVVVSGQCDQAPAERPAQVRPKGQIRWTRAWQQDTEQGVQQSCSPSGPLRPRMSYLCDLPVGLSYALSLTCVDVCVCAPAAYVCVS
jgi:hypothetical protein